MRFPIAEAAAEEFRPAHVAGVGTPRACRASRERAQTSSAPRRRGVRIVIGILLLALSGCATNLDFHPYRACHEPFGRNLHDPGTVVWESIDEETYVRHYGFLPDRLKSDPRQVIDVTHINRMCPLITGTTAGDRQPIGDRWDTSEGRPPQ